MKWDLNGKSSINDHEYIVFMGASSKQMAWSNSSALLDRALGLKGYYSATHYGSICFEICNYIF